MEGRDTDGSDSEHHHEDPQAAFSRKRSSRACDQCRKTKSKCERPAGEAKKCKSCTMAGTDCTFLGPSYKRGPPKGYIHAIEQRWHQVESLLGAVLQCPDPRVQSVVADLRHDDLAREILGRVDTGPYGPSGRRSQPPDATKEDFFASILKSNEAVHADSSRSRRQSRVSREIVSSNQDHGLSVVPTREWQDNLSKHLASHSASTGGFTDDEYVPATQKRRLNGSSSLQVPPTWSSSCTVESSSETDDFKTATEGIGDLSLDEHQEVRFHGQTSGLHLLGRSERNDDRIEGGVWRLPMARVWPPSKFGITTYPLGGVPVELPPQGVQDRLIELYFTNIHPLFPVIHKSRFLSGYQSRDLNDVRGTPSTGCGSTYSSPRPEPTQEVTNLLLFCIFAIAARFLEEDLPNPADNKMWDGGCQYLDSARNILTKVFHISRPCTVQALLLLGYREFGIGSMEQGWIFIGTGVRMAYDLGLNCDSVKWKMHGCELFSPEETQARRQIWWACVLADRYSACYMGRPVMIKYEDFETPLPNVNPTEERDPWRPNLTQDNIPYPPVPARVLSVFCAGSRLAVIVGAIVTEIYPVRPSPGSSKQSHLSDLESRLDQWYITLPEELRYEASTKKQTPTPQILFLNVRYWWAVLLLHRAFIPNWKGNNERPHKSTIGTRAFDLSHSAACHISSIVTVYRDTFTMKNASPFLTCYLLSAGIMDILTLTIGPDNLEASISLRQTMTALKEVEVVWPSASRAWHLLNGVQLRTVANLTPLQTLPHQFVDRNKRHAEEAFGEEKSSDYSQQTYSVPGPPDIPEAGAPMNANGVQDIGTRLMAHMLGLQIPGVGSSTSFYPGWWPRTNQSAFQLSQNWPYPPGTDFASNIQTISAEGPSETDAAANWTANPQPPPPDFGMNSNLDYQYDLDQFGA